MMIKEQMIMNKEHLVSAANRLVQYHNIEQKDEAELQIIALAEKYAQSQVLQQTPCTTLRESLDKMLSKELKLTGKYEWEDDEYKATERITALSIVIKMIDAFQPVA